MLAEVTRRVPNTWPLVMMVVVVVVVSDSALVMKMGRRCDQVLGGRGRDRDRGLKGEMVSEEFMGTEHGFIYVRLESRPLSVPCHDGAEEAGFNGRQAPRRCCCSDAV